MASLKQILRKVKDQQYSPIEVKVREATSSEPWGASTTLLAEIARATHDYQEYPKLLAMVWKRVMDVAHVMHVQKALILIDYLLRNGSQRFVEDCKARSRDIAKLTRYKHYDSNNEDDAVDARAKAKSVYELLTDDNRLAEERAKAEKIKDVKSSGFGSDSYGHGYSGPSSVTTSGLSREAYERAKQIESAFDRSLKGQDDDEEPDSPVASSGFSSGVPATKTAAGADRKASATATRAEIRRPSFEEEAAAVPAASASPARNPAALFEDAFDPFAEPATGVGSAAAAYQARIANGTGVPAPAPAPAAAAPPPSHDSFDDYLISSAAASTAASAPRQPVPMGGGGGDLFDLLTSSTPAPAPVDASGLTDMFAQGMRLGTATPPQQHAPQPQPAASAVTAGWTDFPSTPVKPEAKPQVPGAWGGLGSLSTFPTAAPAPAPPAARTMSDMRQQQHGGFDDVFGAGPAMATPPRQQHQQQPAHMGVSPFAHIPAPAPAPAPHGFPPAAAAAPFDPFAPVPAARAAAPSPFAPVPAQQAPTAFTGLNW